MILRKMIIYHPLLKNVSEVENIDIGCDFKNSQPYYCEPGKQKPGCQLVM